MYGWIMVEHQPITFPQAEFAQDYIVHPSIDWNSRMSSFEEGGIDVGRQSQKFRLNKGTNASLGRPPDNRGRVEKGIGCRSMDQK